MTTAREQYLANLKARLVAHRDGGPVPPEAATLVDAPTFAIAPPVVEEVAPPTPDEPSHVADYHDRVVQRHDLDQVARTLSGESLTRLIDHARQLAAEGH